MKVIATALGFFGQLRQPGAEFEVPDGTPKASWFTPVKEEDPAPAPTPPGRGRRTPAADEPLT